MIAGTLRKTTWVWQPEVGCIRALHEPEPARKPGPGTRITYTPACPGSGPGWTRVENHILTSETSGCAKGSVFLTRVVSRNVGDTSPFTDMKHSDQKTSEFNEDMFEGENFCFMSARISIFVEETGHPRVMGMLWLYRCGTQGKKQTKIPP